MNPSKNINNLKPAIISEFQELSDGMVTSTIENFGTRLEMVLRNKGGHFGKYNIDVVVCSIY